jgi:hypothetical protein
MIGNEVQASEAEGLEGREDGRCPQPSAWGHGKLQRAEANHIAQAREAGGVVDEGHPMPGQWTHDVLPTVGAKLSVSKIAGS